VLVAAEPAVEPVVPATVLVVVPELGEIKNGAENTLGAVKSFWFWPT
jgi:hypothetical protein